MPCNSMHAVAGSSKTALSPSIMLAQGSKLEAALARAEERLSALLAAGSDPNGETARAVDDEIARIRATQTSLRTRLHQQHLEGAPPANLMQDPPFLLDKRTTATSAGIAAAAARLRTLREKRHKFRSECDAHAAMGNPKTFAESNNVEIDDFMPSALEALTLYSSRTLASWMNRGESEGSGGAWGSRSQVTKFKEIVAADERTDTAAVFDFSTLADPTAGKTFKVRSCLRARCDAHRKHTRILVFAGRGCESLPLHLGRGLLRALGGGAARRPHHVLARWRRRPHVH